jgi:hypothetical protein
LGRNPAKLFGAAAEVQTYDLIGGAREDGTPALYNGTMNKAEMIVEGTF